MVGIVADDITGANDIGAMFAEAGHETHVCAGAGLHATCPEGADVVVMDTDSRSMPPEQAREAVSAAVRALRAAGCDRFFKKTCSVFRGNVGAEFDAMLDALGGAFGPRMAVIPGYPSNNRTVLHGIQYVHGQLLEESHFRDDPLHPMATSNIVEILRGQTQRPVAHVDIDTVREGERAVRSAVAALPDDVAYVLFDTANQASLATIAKAMRDARVFGGSAGPASELAKLWRPRAAQTPLPRLEFRAGLGIPVVSGSMAPTTAEQIARLAGAGAALIPLSPAAALSEAGGEAEAARVGALARACLAEGRDAVIHASAGPEDVVRARAEAACGGLSSPEAGRRIAAALGAATADAMRGAGQNRVLAAGGDTSSAVCAHLGVSAMRIGSPIEPGLPLCLSMSESPVALVLKGGSMGSPDFMVRALAALRAL